MSRMAQRPNTFAYCIKVYYSTPFESLGKVHVLLHGVARDEAPHGDIFAGPRLRAYRV